MLQKVKYFPDLRPSFNTELNSEALLTQIGITRNGNPDIFQIFPNISTADNSVSEDLSEFQYSENIVVSYLYINESFSDLDIQVSEFASYTTEIDSTYSSSTLKIKVVSEDKETENIYWVIPVSLGILQDPPILYSVKATTTYPENPEISCKIFQPVLEGNLLVGSVLLPESYFNPVDDTFILNLNFFADSGEYISLDGTDPDNQTLSDGVTDPLTLLTSRSFTVDESNILDPNYVYLVLTSGTDSVYYQLKKNQEYSVDPKLDLLKSRYNDKYIYLFLNDVAVLPNDLTYSQVFQLYQLTDVSSVTTYLGNNNITYDQINSYLPTLIDITETKNINLNPEIKSYNLLYEFPNEIGFSRTEILDFGSVIAQELYDQINSYVTNNPEESDNYQYGLIYLDYIRNRDKSILVQDVFDQDHADNSINQYKQLYIKELASIKTMQILNIRIYRWIYGRLKYLLEQSKEKMLTTVISQYDLIQITSLFDTLILNNNHLIDSTPPLFLDTQIDNFFDQLENIKVNTEVYYQIRW